MMNKYIDHTILKNNAVTSDIKKLCEEAEKYNFKSVCVNPSNIVIAKEFLSNSDVLVCTVVGFPLGASTMETKAFEARDAVSKGAQEIDMVINIAKAKEQDFDYIAKEIKAVVEASKPALVKVIIETSELTKEEIIECSKCVVKSAAQFVKTSTGFSSAGATVENVSIMKQTVGDSACVKASGGIRDLETANKMIEAGATRLGCSAGVNIMKELKGEETDDTNAAY